MKFKINKNVYNYVNALHEQFVFVCANKNAEIKYAVNCS